MQEGLGKVALGEREDDGGLRVAHTHVIFKKIWVAGHIDQSEVDDAAVVDALGKQPGEGGAHNSPERFVDELRRGEGDGAHGAHAAGIWSFVVVV